MNKSLQVIPGNFFLILSLIFTIVALFPADQAAALAPNPPVISSPGNGSSHKGGDYINFAGTCADTVPGDGDLSGSALVWTSSKDGLLGTGQSINVNTLQSGNHTITLTATDSESLSSNSQITITVSNNAPTSTITLPSNGSSFNAGSSVTFSGTGSDIDSSDTLSYSWSSTIGGATTNIGSSSIIAVSNLAVGTHVIVLTVSDGSGAVDGSESTASNPITIEITNNPPTATILSPSNDDTFYTGTTINFNGTGSDTEDVSGALTYAWSCSEHGLLNSSEAFSSAALAAGFHDITFTVTDTQGASNTTPRTITIHVGNFTPVATISSPADGTSYDMDDVIIFQGSAVDTEDGSLTGSSLVWTSNIDTASPIGTGETVTSDALSSGTHIITLTATDTYTTPGTGSASVIITISNTFPTATIANPADNSSFYENADVTFSGSASDAEDGTLSGASLVWSSSIDGDIGTGSPLTYNGLSTGTHSITLKATDSESATTISTPVTISIGNSPPVAVITSPADGSDFNRGDSITFRGTGTDTEDGDLNGSSLTWSSSITGPLGNGTILPVDTLATGTHTITLTATDSQSATGTSSIAVTINNNAPVVTINSPPNESIYDVGASISFTGSASDPEDGFLSGSDLVWVSSIDGNIGTGASVTSTLTKGTHIVTLTATDSESDSGVANVTVHVGNNPPTVSITNPATGSNYETGEYITFQGTSADPEDGTLTGSSLQWMSSIDGNFATGLSPSQINSLSTGRHTITLVATDSNNAVTYSTPISIRVGNNTPIADILTPSNDSAFESGATITFEGTGTDPEDGVLLTSSLVWTSSRQGQLATGTSFSSTTLLSGQHTITLTATDADGASHAVSIVIYAQNSRPVATIATPATGASFDEGTSITLQGTGTDNEDKTLSGSSLIWESDFDGVLGTGTALTLSTLTGGTHTITLTATDSKGLSGTASISLTIVPMTLSANSLIISKGETGSITISGGKPPYRVATRRSQIALPSENNGSVSILGVSEGATFVTVTDNIRKSAVVNVTVSGVGGTVGGSAAPDAWAGPDQSGIEEGDLVYLTGSNVNTQKAGSDLFLWTQTDPANPETPLAEPTVMLSDDTSQGPSFTAPLLDLNGQLVSFRLTITNQEGSDTDTVTISLKDNGITGYPSGAATFMSCSGKKMAAKIRGAGELKILTALDPLSLNLSALPRSMIYGLIDLKIKAPTPGATISLIVYMPEAAPADHKWYKYLKSENLWVDFDRDLISSGTGDGAVFSEDRTSVTLYITDDGRFDDNKTDMIIEDPSGLAKPPVDTVTVSSGSGSDDKDGGCFFTSLPD